MTAIVYCPHCGTANRAGSRFCNRCGTELAADVAASEHQAGQAADAPTSAYPTPPPLMPAEPPAELPAEPPPDDNDPLLAEMLRSQPWLDPAVEEAELAGEGLAGEGIAGESLAGEPGDDAPPAPAPAAPPPRLLAEIEGLIEPLSIPRQAGARPNRASAASSRDAAATPASAPRETLSDEAARRFRQLASEPPHLLEPDYPPARRQRPTDPSANEETDRAGEAGRAAPRTKRRGPWIFWLIGLALLLPFLLDGLAPQSLPLGLRAIQPPGALGASPAALPRWPGVAEAYATIRDLPAESDVLLYWAYDPATAGELDNVALPLVRHLLTRRARLVVVSPLPQGPAAARRLIDQAQSETLLSNPLAAAPGPALELGYLPGGAATLPLLARNLNSLLVNSGPVESEIETALVILLAAETEPVQRWLEQVQPYRTEGDGASAPPVIAVTSAAVDPVARAYWQSGQLTGLVGGFTGAAGYRSLWQNGNDSALARAALRWQRLRLVAQNWGHVALLLLIAAGNAVGLLGGRA